MRKLTITALALALFICAFALPARAAHTPETLLKSIEALAEEGGILNCDFTLRDSYDDVVDEYGAPDRDNYVKSAHGSYATFSHHAVVVGYGNGGEIFELRSYARRLNAITERDVREMLGAPDHTASLDGDRITSYVLDGGYHLKFVFDGEEADAELNHYNVIWMEGTENKRADDHGRKW